MTKNQAIYESQIRQAKMATKNKIVNQEPMNVLKEKYKYIVFTAIPGIITIVGLIIGILNWTWVKKWFWQIENYFSLWQAISLILLLSNLLLIFIFWRICKNLNIKKIIWNNLDKDEKEILKPFKDKNTIKVNMNDDTVKGLIKKGVLIPTSQWLDSILEPCYVATEYIEHLKHL